MILDTIRGREPRSTSLRAGPRHTFTKVKLFMAAMREIFDESAYARFLEGKQMELSCESYAVFLRENEAEKARRPRCC